jgi:hypothetical protein
MKDAEYRAKVLSKERAWHKANPEKSAALAKAKKAKRRGKGTIKAAQILAIVNAQDWLCFWCAGDLKQLGYHADHYIPLSRGGTSDPSNIVGACPH